MFFFMTTNKKPTVLPLLFFSWRPIKNNSVTPYGFFHDDQRKTTVSPLMFHLIKTTVLPLMFHLINTIVVFFFMTTNKKRQFYPLYFIWQRQQCYPLSFFSWRPIKNDSVTPYILFDKGNSVTPYVFFHDDQ
jgi:hypothetical protein